MSSRAYRFFHNFHLEQLVGKQRVENWLKYGDGRYLITDDVKTNEQVYYILSTMKRVIKKRAQRFIITCGMNDMKYGVNPWPNYPQYISEIASMTRHEYKNHVIY